MSIVEVHPGIHQIVQAGTNCYLVEADDAVVFVDAGLPAAWRLADEALRRTGRSWSQVAGILLTHAHFDHLGFAERARREKGVPVFVHGGDRRIAQHPYRYRPGRPRLLYPLRHPGSIPVLGKMVAAGALWVKGVETVHDLLTQDVLDGLDVVPTPGHTDGHCVLHLPDRGVVFTGDALVTLDPYTGRTGPRIVGQAGTKDAPLAARSLPAIAATSASVVLPGHGEPWFDGAASAAELAERRGAA